MHAGRDLATSLRLVLVTDPSLGHPRPLANVVEGALQGGCRCVQLRDKTATPRELAEVAQLLLPLTRASEALLIVNDRFDVAMAVGADGVHLGSDDLPVEAVRRAVPPEFVVGASCDQVEVATQLVASGADYLGCGTVYPTRTKPDAGEAIGVVGIRNLAAASKVPVVAIGGITAARAPDLSASGASGIAVVREIMGADDPRSATRALMSAFQPQG